MAVKDLLERIIFDTTQNAPKTTEILKEKLCAIAISQTPVSYAKVLGYPLSSD